MDNYKHPILLFDGVCHFCDGAVQFLIRHDKKGVIKFAPLQSTTGQKLLRDLQLSTIDFDSLVFISTDRYYTKSTAVLKIGYHLGGKWRLLSTILTCIPRPLCDIIYRNVAKNRYKWFGQKDQCMIPSPEIRKRFLT